MTRGDLPHANGPHLRGEAGATSSRRLALLAAIAAALAGGLYLVAVVDRGFPDGHLTEYQRWALPLQEATVAGLVVIALGSAGLAIRRGQAAGGAALSRLLLVVLVLLAAAALAVPFVGREVLHLEDGEGG